MPSRNSLATRECLRIRISENKKEITYKPSTKKDHCDCDFFVKQELNLPIDNTRLAKKLLLAPSCQELATIQHLTKNYFYVNF